ncbi:unnamed protein product, partial [Prorocentrum cordatum]
HTHTLVVSVREMDMALPLPRTPSLVSETSSVRGARSIRATPSVFSARSVRGAPSIRGSPGEAAGNARLSSDGGPRRGSDAEATDAALALRQASDVEALWSRRDTMEASWRRYESIWEARSGSDPDLSSGEDSDQQAEARPHRGPRWRPSLPCCCEKEGGGTGSGYGGDQ